MKLAILSAGVFALGATWATAQTYRISTVEWPGGAGSVPQLTWPMGVVVDEARNLYLSEYNVHAVRKLTPGGTATTLAGHPGQVGSADGIGSEARFFAHFGSLGLALDEAGNLIVADPGNHAIRKVSPEGVVMTLAGLAGARGSEDGTGSEARFNVPFGVAVDRRGTVYVADLGNHTIRKITPAGVVTTLAGVAGRSGGDDGVGSEARFSSPACVAVDAEGNVYVGSYDDTVRRVTPEGRVTTLAGYSGRPGWIDGPGREARFGFSHSHFDAAPFGIAVDPAGNVLVVDPGSLVVRRITPDGIVTSFGRSMQMSWPGGIAIHRSGEVYIADSGNRRVLKAVPESNLAIIAAPQAQTIAPGTTVTFRVTAGGASGVKYQWFKDGTLLAGAAHATLVLPAATEREAGTYRCVVSDSTGFAIETSAGLNVVASADPGRLINFSIRSRVTAASPALVMGATVTGAVSNQPLPVLARASGPALVRFGIPDFLPDPELAVSVGGVVVAANDNWGGDRVAAAQMTQVGAFDYLQPASLDAALAAALVPNTYHLHIRDKTGAGGLTLGEIYDATPGGARGAGTPRLSNLAARHQVERGGDVLIAGFSIGGETAKTVLLRGVGPSLAAFGVSGGLVDPVIELYLSRTLLHVNDDWGGDGQIARVADSVHAFPLASPDSKDAALLVTLPPGSYTMRVRGANDSAGVALAEIYEVP
jgi:DNA-binding beta-propeller fold protein YncE